MNELIQTFSSPKAMGEWTKKHYQGLLVSAALTVVAMIINHFLPIISALLLAILLGAIMANVRPILMHWRPGLGFASKHLLRAGIVLLGLQISVGALVGLGWQTLVLVVTVVTVGVLSTMLIGKLMGMPFRLVALVACGFSICGAAAVAGAKETVHADHNETATALALVVVFGTLSIPIVPALATLMGLGPEVSGIWIGASVHEVAQVVAAAAAIGNKTIEIAVIVKLARVVCLAGVMAGFGLWMRKRNTGEVAGKRPPLVPGFVIGFLLMVVLASVVKIPADISAAVKMLQTILLTMAMGALGCGINIRHMLEVGHKPVVLGLIATIIVSLVALGGAIII